MFDITAQTEEYGTAISVKAKTLLRDICLFPDRLDSSADVDEMLVTLLPGEQKTFRIRHKAEITTESFASNLRCANDLFKRSL